MSRLLAYGGTSYSERAQRGAWAVDTSILGEREGLNEGISFGLGVDHAGPFLIYRALQNVESRGGYPYTILWDPGPASWEAFCWNVPGLVTMLKGNPDLTSQPESIEFDGRLPPPVLDYTAKLTKLHFILAASMFSEKVVVVKPEHVGFQSRPSPEQLLCLLNYDPQASQDPCWCFTGRGFLIGGGAAVAGGLGARLAIHEGSLMTEKTVDDLAQIGRDFLSDWQCVERWNQSLLTPLACRPAWEWPWSPSKVKDGLRLLNSLREEQVSDPLIENAGTYLANADAPFSTAIADVGRQAALRGPFSLSQVRMVYLLKDHFRFGSEIPADVAKRFDKEFLVSELLRRDLSPQSFPATIHIPRKTLLEAWARWVAESDSDSKRERFQEAIDYLEARSPITREDYEVLLSRVTFDDLDSQQVNAWSELSHKKALDSILRKKIGPRVRRSVSERDYRKYAEAQLIWMTDDEIFQLVQGLNPKERVSEIVSSWADERHGRYGKEVETRLGLLARSRLRTLLRNDVKQRVAELTEDTGSGEGPWSNYLRIYMLFHGGTPTSSAAVPDEEMHFLQLDVDELFHHENSDKTPKLAQLVRLVDPLLAKTKRRIQEMTQPSPSKPGFEDWQEGLQLLGLTDLFKENAFEHSFDRKVRSLPAEVDASPLIEPFDPESLLKTWKRWLLERTLTPKDWVKFDKALDAEIILRESLPIIEQVLREAQQEQLIVFMQRFQDPIRLESFLRPLPEAIRVEVISRLTQDRTFFEDVCEPKISEAISNGGPYTPFHQALAAYLLGNEEELQSCEKGIYGRPDVKAFRESLNAIRIDS